MNQKKVYWLLDSRFDFLLPSFMHETGVQKQDIVLVNSYHGKSRTGWNKIFIPFETEQSVVQMEPDDMNRFFSKLLPLDKKATVISFSGAGLPQNENLFSMTATGKIAETCNDKWWQYNQFAKIQVPTPKTYLYHGFSSARNQLDNLLEKHKKLIIKKPSLSGGYQMSVLSSEEDFKRYWARTQEEDNGQELLLSEYIPHRQSFAAMGVVRRDGGSVFIPIITEQVLYRQIAYEGLLFPAFLDEAQKDQIRQMTDKIGKMLGENGYYGFFNVDFVLAEDNQLYAVEINARWGFGTILAACMYGKHFWKAVQGIGTEEIRYPQKCLAIGKIKAKMGRTYAGLESYSSITEWFEREEGSFRTFFCGTDEPEKFVYGSYIGVFGEFFAEEEDRMEVLEKFWGNCMGY